MFKLKVRITLGNSQVLSFVHTDIEDKVVLLRSALNYISTLEPYIGRNNLRELSILLKNELKDSKLVNIDYFNSSILDGDVRIVVVQEKVK